MNPNIKATPLSKYLNIGSNPANKKYIDLKPRMAKTLDVNNITGSFETENIAGIESTANNRSVNSTTPTTISKGVACLTHLPPEPLGINFLIKNFTAAT